MKKLHISPDGAVCIEADGARYEASLAEHRADSGLELAVPDGIRYLEYRQDDGRVIGHTQEGNQVELKDYDVAALEAALSGAGEAIAARGERAARAAREAEQRAEKAAPVTFGRMRPRAAAAAATVKEY